MGGNIRRHANSTKGTYQFQPYIKKSEDKCSTEESEFTAFFSLHPAAVGTSKAELKRSLGKHFDRGQSVKSGDKIGIRLLRNSSSTGRPRNKAEQKRAGKRRYSISFLSN